jgi:regulator of sigma E protease
VDRSFEYPVSARSAAREAKPPFEFEDRIVATTDPDQPQGYDPKKVRELPLDPRNPGSGLRDYFEFRRRMQELAGKEVTIRVLRGAPGKQQSVDILVPPAFHYTFGARMQMGQVTAIRQGSTAQRAGVQARDIKRSLNGDIIEKVELPEPDGKVTIYDKDKDLDPVRLPFQLREWAARWARASRSVGDRTDLDKTMIVKLHVLRHNVDKRQQDEAKVLEVPWERSWRFDHELPFNQDSPQPIPELGLAYQIKTTVVAVEPGQDGAQPIPLQPGDVIKAVRLSAFGNSQDDQEPEKKPWMELQPEQWAFVFDVFQHPAVARQLAVKVERNKEEKEFTVPAHESKSWPRADRGFILASDTRLQKADSFFEAASMGFKDTYTIMVQVFQNLRGMFTHRISVKGLGGPLTIANIAFTIAGVDFWEFLFFLGMISVNLAVINFLPIPVLDGGHMVFLLYEKLRGKPAPETVRVGATYAGLLLLACVMMFVLYLDIRRLIH